MATTYGTVITNAGAALIAECILNGTKLPITEAAVGDGNGEPYSPTPAQTELKNEKWRGEIVSATISTTTENRHRRRCGRLCGPRSGYLLGRRRNGRRVQYPRH